MKGDVLKQVKGELMKKGLFLEVVGIAVVLISCVTSPLLPPEERIIQQVLEVDKSKE